MAHSMYFSMFTIGTDVFGKSSLTQRNTEQLRCYIKDNDNYTDVGDYLPNPVGRAFHLTVLLQRQAVQMKGCD